MLYILFISLLKKKGLYLTLKVLVIVGLLMSDDGSSQLASGTGVLA